MNVDPDSTVATEIIREQRAEIERLRAVLDAAEAWIAGPHPFFSRDEADDQKIEAVRLGMAIFKAVEEYRKSTRTPPKTFSAPSS